MGLLSMSYQIMAAERIMSYVNINTEAVKEVLQDFGSKLSDNMENGQGVAGSAWNAIRDTVTEAVSAAKLPLDDTETVQDVEPVNAGNLDKSASDYVESMQDYAKSVGVSEQGTQDLRNAYTAQILGNLYENGYSGADMECGV